MVTHYINYYSQPAIISHVCVDAQLAGYQSRFYHSRVLHVSGGGSEQNQVSGNPDRKHHAFHKEAKS